MVRITIDEELKKQLLAANGSVELCDESGVLVGRVTAVKPEKTDPWSNFPDLTEGEIKRIANGPGPWLTTEEFKDELRKRLS